VLIHVTDIKIVKKTSATTAKESNNSIWSGTEKDISRCKLYT